MKSYVRQSNVLTLTESRKPLQALLETIGKIEVEMQKPLVSLEIIKVPLTSAQSNIAAFNETIKKNKMKVKNLNAIVELSLPLEELQANLCKIENIPEAQHLKILQEPLNKFSDGVKEASLILEEDKNVKAVNTDLRRSIDKIKKAIEVAPGDVEHQAVQSTLHL